MNRVILTENMRQILDKVSNYVDSVNEATPDLDKNKKDNDQSLDDLLTKEAGSARLIKSINPTELAKKLGLTADQTHSLASALNELGSITPHFNKDQAEVLATGLLNLVNPPKQQSNQSRIDQLKETIKKAIDFNPNVKQHALPLIQSIIETRNNSSDESVNEIIEQISSIIETAINTNENHSNDILTQIKENVNRDDFHSILNQICEEIISTQR